MSETENRSVDCFVHTGALNRWMLANNVTAGELAKRLDLEVDVVHRAVTGGLVVSEAAAAVLEAATGVKVVRVAASTEKEVVEQLNDRARRRREARAKRRKGGRPRLREDFLEGDWVLAPEADLVPHPDGHFLVEVGVRAPVPA